MLHRTGAYYTAQLKFCHDFPVKVGGAYYTSVCIKFEFLRYVNQCGFVGIKIKVVINNFFPAFTVIIIIYVIMAKIPRPGRSTPEPQKFVNMDSRGHGQALKTTSVV